MRRVISLWQPFASLIFVGVKTYETRGFAFPTKLEGETIGIHATQKFTPNHMISKNLDALCESVFGKDYKIDLPRSVILGSVMLEKNHATEDIRSTVSPNNLITGDWTEGRYAWELTNFVEYDEPIPAKGKQGWWNYDPNLVSRG